MSARRAFAARAVAAALVAIAACGAPAKPARAPDEPPTCSAGGEPCPDGTVCVVDPCAVAPCVAGHCQRQDG